MHALKVNGRRKLLLSGAIHYPRSTPAMWPGIPAESKAAGLNTIDTYVFWGRHEPQEGVWTVNQWAAKPRLRHSDWRTARPCRRHPGPRALQRDRTRTPTPGILT